MQLQLKKYCSQVIHEWGKMLRAMSVFLSAKPVVPAGNTLRKGIFPAYPGTDCAKPVRSAACYIPFSLRDENTTIYLSFSFAKLVILSY